jgi:hypothetical protein
MADPPRIGISLKGRAAIIVAVGTVVVLLILIRASRIFFAICLGIAVIVTAVLYFWHKLRPIRPEDIDDKRPLNLK